MIQLAKISQIKNILKLTDACRIEMESKNIFQWTTDYPNKQAFEKDIVRNELYVLLSDKKIIGCIVISSHFDKEYQTVKWLTANDNNIYIHRLAVHPSFQGKGYAQQLMDFAENYAHEQKAISIRLDTFSQNKRNQHFYEQRGYVKLENIHFYNQSEYPFHCYELVL